MMVWHVVKRSAVLMLVATLSIPTTTQNAARAATQETPLSESFLPGDSIEAVPMAGWDVTDAGGSRTLSASGQGAVDQAPNDASRFTQKSYDFPTGSIRVLEFNKANGGMIHVLTDETTLYMLKGEGTVEVAGETVSINQGDAVSYPSGTLRGDGDGTAILWVVTGNDIEGEPKPKVVRSVDTTFAQMGYWPNPDGGDRILVTTAEELKDAPAHAIRLDMRNYAFDDNGLVVTKNYKSGPTNKSRGNRDALLYIASGKMRWFQDDIDVTAVPGDAIRETAGRYHNWIRMEDSSFIGIGTAPAAPLEPEAASDY